MPEVLSRSKWKTLKRKVLKCLELTIVKKKWCILFAYHPSNTDKEEFFDEVSANLNKILGKYNIILAGDLNIDKLRPGSDSSKNHLSDIYERYIWPGKPY